MYNKKTWQDCELITPDSLNNIESGIENIDYKINNIENKIENINEVLKSSVYFIELEKWGIHNGFPEDRGYVLSDDGVTYLPKYTDEEYTIAHNNKEGINAALQYAVENGYNAAVLPNGSEIYICWEEPNPNCAAYYMYSGQHIIMQSNLVFDMNYSTIKVIYDSRNINPYDKSKHSDNNPIYHLSGCLIAVRACYNSTIKNGTLMGTLYERHFNDKYDVSGKLERNYDFGVGIALSQGSSFIRIENMDLKGFMADGLTGSSDHDPAKGTEVHNPPFNFNGYINNSGELVNEAGSYSTDYLSIADWTAKEGIMRTNIGYTRVPNIYNEEFLVSFFNKDKEFILISKERYLQNFIIPKGAAFLRISILRDTKDLELGFRKDFRITPKAGEFVSVSFCEIHENHRGGISNISHHAIVDKCKIYNNGLGTYEGVPVFGDATRYGINCEDCLPSSLTIKDCYIYNTYHGILFAGGTIHCHNNTFYKLGGCSINLYNCENAFISENLFIGCGLNGIGSTGSSTYDRTAMINNNKFINAHLRVDPSNNIHYLASGNVFKGAVNFNIGVSSSSRARDIIYDFYRPDDHSYVGASFCADNCIDTTINIHEAPTSTASITVSSNERTRNLEVNNLSGIQPHLKTNRLYNAILNNFVYVATALSSKTYDDGTTYRVNNTTVKNTVLNNTGFQAGEYVNYDIHENFDLKNVEFNIDIAEFHFFRAEYYCNDCYKIYNLNFDSCTFNISALLNKSLMYIRNSKNIGDIVFNNCIFNNNTSDELNILTCFIYEAISEGFDLNIKFNNCTFNGAFKGMSIESLKNNVHFFKNGVSVEYNSLL